MSILACYIANHITYISYISYDHIEICNVSDIAHHVKYILNTISHVPISAILFARNTFAEVAHPTKLSGVRGVCNKNGKVAEGSTRYTPEVVSSLRVHMCTRSPVATDKGIAEAIHKLSIVAPFAYLLPTH